MILSTSPDRAVRMIMGASISRRRIRQRDKPSNSGSMRSRIIKLGRPFLAISSSSILHPLLTVDSTTQSLRRTVKDEIKAGVK
jgi:hypothetical protein